MSPSENRQWFPALINWDNIHHKLKKIKVARTINSTVHKI